MPLLRLRRPIQAQSQWLEPTVALGAQRYHPGQLLRTASLVNHYKGVGTYDTGVLYRQYINTYAVRDDWDELFVAEQQSTIFYKQAFETEYAPTLEAMRNDVLNNHSYYYYPRDGRTAPFDVDACLRECAAHGGNEPALTERMNAMSMIYNSSDGLCICTTTNWLDLANDHLIMHHPGQTELRTYRIKFCPGVAGGSSRSVVYRKNVKGPNAVCMGMPVQGGAILTGGSILISRDAGDYSTPIDSQCRAACDANPDCALAHSFVETFDLQNLAHNLPPPPEPPSPPLPPPPRTAAAAVSARAAARRRRRPARLVARRLQRGARGHRRRVGRQLSHLLRVRKRVWQRWQRLPRQHLFVAVAAGRPRDGAQDDRPRHVSRQRLSLRVRAHGRAARRVGGERAHLLGGAGLSGRDFRTRATRTRNFAVRAERGYGRERCRRRPAAAASAARGAQRRHRRVPRGHIAPAAGGARRVADQPRTRRPGRDLARLGDCGLFLGALVARAQLWRRSTGTRVWCSTSVTSTSLSTTSTATVHTSAEGEYSERSMSACGGRVCARRQVLVPCPGGRGNIITPAVLLASRECGMAYPPPTPPRHRRQ